MTKGKVIGAIVALVVVGGAATAFALGGSRAPEVSVAAAERGDLGVTVSASGRIQADEKVDIYPPTAGVLASVEVTEGQAVKAGQVVATMDAGPLEVQVAQAEAAYRGAVAQRDAVAKAVPGASDKAAAQAAVNVAWDAYELADAQYEAAKAGLGAPSPADIASAQTAVAVAQAAYDTATSAYTNFYTNVYLPAPEPRDATLESTLAVLALARDQAYASLITAQQNLAVLLAAADNTGAIALAESAKNQAYAAYLGAVAQKDALAKASSVGTALSSADAAIDAAAAGLKLAEDTLADTEIIAPMDGVVIFNSLSGVLPGGPVVKPTVGSSVSPAAAPFTIVVFDQLTFNAQVDEADVTRVEPGMKASVSLDGLPATSFETEVERVEKQSVLTPTGGTAFPVLLRLKNIDDEVLLGMNGSVEIIVETIADAVTVPVEAVLEQGTTSFVYVVKDGKAVFTEVQLGRLTDTRAELISGASEGDQVITSGVADLSDGDSVRVK